MAGEHSDTSHCMPWGSESVGESCILGPGGQSDTSYCVPTQGVKNVTGAAF